MSLKVAVQMDPIEGINIEGDTTFLMMEAAQARGHSLFVYTTDTLAMDEARVYARGRDVSVARVKGDHANSLSIAGPQLGRPAAIWPAPAGFRRRVQPRGPYAYFKHLRTKSSEP